MDTLFKPLNISKEQVMQKQEKYSQGLEDVLMYRCSDVLSQLSLVSRAAALRVPGGAVKFAPLCDHSSGPERAQLCRRH